jgi:chlorophyll synthase
MSELDIPLRASDRPQTLPSPKVVLELLKPITWFPPMWAFLCGVVSSGAHLQAHWKTALLGAVLAGPAICATSQAANDWFDRHVDAINEPGRPIPSGRLPGRWGLWVAIVWTLLSFALALILGGPIVPAAALGLALAWAYSAPPLRLKQRGWCGPIAVALCYEGLAWFTGAAAAGGGFPNPRVVALAALYSGGAVGIMVLNDFKSIEGDVRTKTLSVPAELGVANAVSLACSIMAAPQIVVIALMLAWRAPIGAGVIALSLIVQLILMRRLLAAPAARAPWYNATGTSLYVLGMLAAGIAVGRLGAPL